MTVSSSTSQATFEGNGATVFPLPFRFFDSDDIFVYRVDPDTGAASLQSLGTDYSLAGAGEPEVDGAALSELTLTAPLAVGTNLLVERVLPLEQAVDIVNQGKFFADVHEDVFDRLVMLVQQVNATSKGAIRVAIGDPEPNRLVPAASRANLLMGFDSTGHPIPVSPSNGDVSAFALMLANYLNPFQGAALVGRAGQFVASRAALRTLSKSTPSKHAFCTGHSGQGDGGHGAFWLDESDTTSADNDGTLIVGADGGRWKMVVQGSIGIEAFGALAIPARNNSAYLATAVAYAYNNDLELLAGRGTFEFASTLDLSYPTLAFRGAGMRNTVLKFTGAGLAVRADGDRPNNGAFSFDFDLADLTIEGSTTATTLLRVRINHARLKNINAREANSASGVAYRIEGVVAGQFDNLTCSTNTQLMTHRPLRGLIIDHDPTDSRRATDNLFTNLTIEGMLEDGIHLDKADFTKFDGGTSENNDGAGINIMSGCTGTKMDNVCFENAGFADVFDDGKSTALDNCYGTKGLSIGPNAVHHHTNGGFWNDVFEDAAAKHSTIENIEFNILIADPGTVSLGSSTWSVRNLRNAQTGLLFVPQKPLVSPAVPASGGTITNTTQVEVDVFVYGGTGVTSTLNRGASTIGPLGGDQAFRLPAGASFVLTYTGAPTVKFAPVGSEFT